MALCAVRVQQGAIMFNVIIFRRANFGSRIVSIQAQALSKLLCVNTQMFLYFAGFDPTNW